MDTKTEQLPTDQPLLSWSAPNRPMHQRSQRWYALAGGAVVLGAAYGILSGSWTLTIVLLLCAGIYVLARGHEPPQHTIACWQNGIVYDGAFTRWEDLQGFWFVYAAEYAALHLTYKQKNREEAVIHTTSQDAEMLRQFLSNFTTELTDRKENAIDIIIRICKL